MNLRSHTEAGTPGRADAQANRTKLLEAARVALQSPAPLSMQAVARKAGVGQGTLYRHFPTKEDLILAVHRNDVDALIAEADVLLAVRTSEEALRAWLELLGDYGRLKHGLGAVLDSENRNDLATEHEGLVTSAISRLVEASQRDGWMRPDVHGVDILNLVGFLWRMPPSGDRDTMTRRLTDIVLQGVRIS